MNYVALEAVPVDFVAVQLNESPVLREEFIAGSDGNRRGVEDFSQDAVVLYGPKPRGLAVELVQGHRRLLHLHQLALQRLPRVSYLGALALDGLPQTLKLGCVMVSH